LIERVTAKSAKAGFRYCQLQARNSRAQPVRPSACLTWALPGVVLWKEKVGARSGLGIALTVISVVLIQLGKSAGK
jgi:hypothetical protein